MPKPKRPTDFAVLQIKMMMEVGFTAEEIAAYFWVDQVSEKDIKRIIKKFMP